MKAAWMSACIVALLLALAASAVAAPRAKGEGARKKGGEARTEMILKASAALKKLGFYKGEPGTKWSSELREATEAFQKNRGLKVTGRLNKDTRRSLALEGEPEGRSGSGRASSEKERGDQP